MKLRTRLLALVSVALAAVGVGAAPLNYSSRSITIRAGVLLIDSQQTGGEPSNYNPYVWLNLDSNRQIKPGGWAFTNPRGATQVTPAIAARSVALGQTALVTGANLNKRNAAYWEVRLSKATDAQMAEFDVLHLSAYGYVALNPLERERLRRFMDKGGVLWVDLWNGTNLDPINGLPLPFERNTANLGGSFSYDFSHPVLTFPLPVSEDSIYRMQSDFSSGLKPVDFTNATIAAIQPILSSLEPDYYKLYPVAADNLGPFLSVGKVGDGYMVVTARGVARTLNRVVDSGGSYNINTDSSALPPTFDRSSIAAAKLVVNLCNLPSGFSQTAGGTRKSNGSFVDLTAPLLKRFDSELPFSNANRVYIPPAVFKGAVFVCDSNRVYAYDANPAADLDRDGDADDGIRDFAAGSNNDLLWISAPLNGPISAPACVEVPNANGTPTDQVLVQESNGRLVCFNAFTLNGSGQILATNSLAPAYSVSPPAQAQFDLSADGRGPFAPTVHEGIAFIGDEFQFSGTQVGRMWMVDVANGVPLQTGGTQWSIGTGSASLAPISASPTIGYISILDNSGGVDKVAYLAGRNNAFGAGPTSSASIFSLWLGARGEKPTAADVSGAILTITTRASLQGLPVFVPGGPSTLGPRLVLIKSNGDPYTPAEMGARFTGAVTQAGGIVNFTLTGAGQALLATELDPSNPNKASVRIDYNIDCGVPAITSQIIRGQLYLPDKDTGRDRRVLHNLALSPEGTLHLVSSNQQQFGSYMAFREEGRGSFKMVNRYDLYPRHTITLFNTTQVVYNETLVDNDGVVQFAPGFLAGAFTNLTFTSGPAIQNGTCYVMARGFKNGFVPCGIVMAFKAEPEVSEIEIGDISGSFTVLQPDIARSTNKTQPEKFSILQPNQYVYERNIGAGRGTLRLDNLMASTRGPITNSLSTSQPIIIRRSGQPDLLIEPDKSGSRWNPMLWYSVFHGVTNNSPMLVTGNTAFFAGNSILPNLISGGPFAPRGLLTGVDGTISPTDPFLVGNTARPWQKQLVQLKVINLGTGDIQPNPAIRWPQSTGVTNFNDWRVRVLQTTLGNSSDAFGVVGGDGALFSWGPLGLWGYSRADFVVADEGRLSRFDPSGNPIWNSDATASSGTSLDVGGAGSIRGLVRPTRAYPVGQSEMVVVDTGADRIIRVDATGRELRSISDIRLDANYRPEGFESNQAMKLSQPRDVLVFETTETNPAGMSNAQPLERWVHYFIADTGNRRLVEIIDRYRLNPVTRVNEGVITDGNGQKALGVLYWQTPASLSGKRFFYNSVARVFVSDVAHGDHYLYAAGIGGTLPTRTDTGLDTPAAASVRQSDGGNGGIVIFDGSESTVINEVNVPAIAANTFWDWTTNSFNSAARPATKKALGGLSSVTMRNVIDPVLGSVTAIMFTDATGVYEIMPSNVAGQYQVRWMLPREAYKVLRRTGAPGGQPWLGVPSTQNPVDFRPTYARRLDSGEVLVVNNYSGRRLANTEFLGEVIQLDGDVDTTNDNTLFGFGFGKTNLGFRSLSVRFELPPVQGARGLVLPVFADRR